MKKRFAAVILIGIGFAAGFVTCYLLKNTPRQLVTQPVQAVVSSSPTSPALAAEISGPGKDDSFVRYFGQAGLAQYQRELADFTRTGGVGTFHFVFHDPVVGEYRPSDPTEQMELMRHRSLHLIDTGHQPLVDLIDNK